MEQNDKKYMAIIISEDKYINAIDTLDIKLLDQKCNSEDINACNSLGRAYFFGDKVAKDYTKASKMFEKSLEYMIEEVIPAFPTSLTPSISISISLFFDCNK